MNKKIFVDANLLIYLNIPLSEEQSDLVLDFFKFLLKNDLYTDILVLDEVIYISRKKYGVDNELTLEFIDKVIVSNFSIVPLGFNEYVKAKEYILRYNLKPSDAIHVAAMDSHGITLIASEDKAFDKTHVERLWISSKFH